MIFPPPNQAFLVNLSIFEKKKKNLTPETTLQQESDFLSFYQRSPLITINQRTNLFHTLYKIITLYKIYPFMLSKKSKSCIILTKIFLIVIFLIKGVPSFYNSFLTFLHRGIQGNI